MVFLICLSQLCDWAGVDDPESHIMAFRNNIGIYIRLVFYGFITVGGHLAHLAYHVHKSGHKTPIIIF